MKNYIIFENNKCVEIEEVSSVYPFSMLESDIIVLEVAQFIADSIYKISKDKVEYKVLVNFLCQRSNKVKNIAVVINLSKADKISEICLDYMNDSFSFLFDYEIKIKPKRLSKNYLDNSLILSSLIKIFPNNLFLLYYRLFFNSKKKKDSVIRAWVDLDEQLHLKYFESSTVFIYPFGINLFRSYNFIKYCFNKHESVTLMGIPYSFYKFLNILFKKIRKNDFGIISFEIDGMVKHTKQLGSFYTIYTSDEYIPAIFSLYHNLKINKKVEVINNCHGIGMYNRFINYDQILVFNEKQKSFYEISSPNVNFEVKLKKTLKKELKNSNQHIDIIFLEQGELNKYGLQYENALQDEIFNILNNISGIQNLNILVKFHPNRSSESKQNVIKHYPNITEYLMLDTNHNSYKYFLNLFSTAYFDFVDQGNFYFIHDQYFNPSKIFGSEIETVHIKNLEQKLLDLNISYGF